jgi:hypothetical protein
VIFVKEGLLPAAAGSEMSGFRGQTSDNNFDNATPLVLLIPDI